VNAAAVGPDDQGGAPTGGPGSSSVDPSATTNALALGCQMALLYHDGVHRQVPPPPAPRRLPSASNLRPDQKSGLSIDRIEARLAALAQFISAVDLPLPPTGALRACYEGSDSTAQQGRDAVYQLHLKVLQTLVATDYRLGTAYGLGRSLTDSCVRATSVDTLKSAFGHGRLDNLRAWLNDLVTALPDHSGKAVLQSLTSWEAWIANLPASGPPDTVSATEINQIRRTLRRQGELWRAVLTGEKAGRDLLTEDDYLTAGRALLARGTGIAWDLLKRIWLWPLAAVAAVVLTTVLVSPGGVAQLVTIVSAIAAAFGLTWKTVGGTLGNAAEKLERPLWGAELDAAVARAVTYLPAVGPPPPDIDVLLETPLFLRVLQATGQETAGKGATIEEFTTAVTSWRDRNRRGGSRGDRWTVRASIWSGGAPSRDKVLYWINWAKAAQYVQLLDDTHYDITPAGAQLSKIPRGQESTIFAALTASRPSVVAEFVPARSPRSAPEAPLGAG
jgi:hypothetical protein